jgi:hypothetical protein
MSASNGLPAGTQARLLRGQGAIGAAQEAAHQPVKRSDPHGPFVDTDGSRYCVGSKSGSAPARDGAMTQVEA